MGAREAYHVCFQHPDNAQKNQVSPLQSSQVCAGHIGLYKQMSSEEQTHLVCNHCRRFLH